MEKQYVKSGYLHSELTDKILAAFYKVYHQLGYGFLEKVYENALGLELEALGVPFVHQAPIQVCYRDKVVGEYFADLLVNDLVVVEIKATRALTPDCEAQLLNYLVATRCEVGLLLNFGPKPEVRRKAFANSRKPPLQSHSFQPD
jgi:GxxExxY protein